MADMLLKEKPQPFQTLRHTGYNITKIFEIFANLESKKRKISGMENEEETKSQSREGELKLNGPRGD